MLYRRSLAGGTVSFGTQFFSCSWGFIWSIAFAISGAVSCFFVPHWANQIGWRLKTSVKMGISAEGWDGSYTKHFWLNMVVNASVVSTCAGSCHWGWKMFLELLLPVSLYILPQYSWLDARLQSFDLIHCKWNCLALSMLLLLMYMHTVLCCCFIRLPPSFWGIFAVPGMPFCICYTTVDPLCS